MRSRRHDRGFTLVELMVVVALVGVLTTVAAITMTGRTYGANAASVSEDVNWAFGFAKLRAISTQRYHRVVVTPQAVTTYQGNTLGMTAPTAYVFVRQTTIPSGISIWNTSSTVQASPGATVTQNASLSTNFDFRPDGSSTGGTAFITDLQGSMHYRVLVYRLTGSGYARELW